MSEQTPQPPSGHPFGHPSGTGGFTPPPTPPTPPAAPPPPPPPAPPGEGGFTPPPPPPPPPAGPGGDAPYNAPDAIGYGWSKFWKRPGDLLVPALIVVLISIVWSVVVSIVLESIFANNFLAALFSAALSSAIGGLVTFALGAGLIKIALDVVDGKQVSVGDVFTVATRTDVLTLAVILSAASFVGTLLCYVGAIAVGFFTWFAYYFLLDHGLSPIEAIKAGINFTTSHISDVLVLAMLGVLVLFAGAVLCLVGLFAAWPIVLIASAYTFRRLHGQPVAPVA